MKRSLSFVFALCAVLGHVTHSSIGQGPVGGGTPGYNGPPGGGTPHGGNGGLGGGGYDTGGRGGGTPNGGSGGGDEPDRPPNGRPGGGDGGKRLIPRPLVRQPRRIEPSTLEWSVWWEMNDDRFLRLKSALRLRDTSSENVDLLLGDTSTLGKPASSPDRIGEAAAPALLLGLKDPWWDARAAALIALGKIGDGTDPVLFERMKAALSDDVAEVREAACLGLGLLGGADAVRLLLSVYNDDKAAQALYRNRNIPVRQRALAAAAVGLAGGRSTVEAEASVVKALLLGVRTKSAAVELQVAPAAALGVLGAVSAAPELLKIAEDEAIDADVRAEAVTSLGKLGYRVAVRFLADRGLSDRMTAVQRSSAVALGLLVDKDDQASVERLIEAADNAADRAVRNFAIIALGEIGSPLGRTALERFVAHGGGNDKTFGALACGIYGFKFKGARKELGTLLLAQYTAAKSDDERSALALALGLADCREALPAFHEELKAGGSPLQKGYVSLATGLLSGKKRIETIHLLRVQAMQTKDLDVQRRASVALGLCGDRVAVEVLSDVLRAASGNGPVFASAAIALGLIGDATVVPLLGAALENKNGDRQSYERAFAAVALGILGDRELISILAKLHGNSNYVSPTAALAETFVPY